MASSATYAATNAAPTSVGVNRLCAELAINILSRDGSQPGVATGPSGPFSIGLFLISKYAAELCHDREGST
jgi:hypothetical protein